mmetsp:Transcript_36696/g.64533  ORF Transcript_36696/g.64533 Transcript_36696/m.64533 type:complete len:137 (+) Transcript_36696:1-411(+)
MLRDFLSDHAVPALGGLKPPAAAACASSTASCHSHSEGVEESESEGVDASPSCAEKDPKEEEVADEANTPEEVPSVSEALSIASLFPPSPPRQSQTQRMCLLVPVATGTAFVIVAALLAGACVGRVSTVCYRFRRS